MISVEALNAAFPKYPMTIRDKGWIYGVWYCGTGWQRVKIHGQYPQTFLNRALALFPEAKNILHAPCGSLEGVPGVTFDAICDERRRPMIVGDCGALPFADGALDLILSDPPYTPKDSKIYGCKPFPMMKFMAEAKRTLRPGGHLGMLHTYYPRYKRGDFNLIGLIAVVTGFSRATRMFSIFEKPRQLRLEVQ